MRVVIDLQGAQTESRFRGIGRYSLNFSKALIKNNKEDEFILVLNGLLFDSIEFIRSEFENILSQKNIRVFYSPGPTKEINNNNYKIRQIGEKIREGFLASLSPDFVIVTSLFEGWGDNAITSIGTFVPDLPTAVILYDLFPLKNKEKCFQTEEHLNWYDRKIKHLLNANLLLAISDYSNIEAQKLLGIDKSKIKTIGGGIDLNFQLDPISISCQEILKNLKIEKKFILCVGGGDEGKNIKGLIKAFSLIPPSIKNEYQLIHVGRIPPSINEDWKLEAKSAGLIKNDFITLGYLEDTLLIKLYQNCSLFVFPSLAEGFGLPPLEAMCCGAPVIASNRTSIPEVVGLDEALFDPTNIVNMKDKIIQGLTDLKFKENLIRHGLIQSKNFSWEKSADIAINFLKENNINKNHNIISYIKTYNNEITIKETGIFKKNNKKILLIKLDHRGDFILAIPAIMKLKAKYPYAKIDIMVGKWNVDIAKSLNIFNNIIEYNFFKEKSEIAPTYGIDQIIEELQEYDVAIDLRRQRDTRFMLAKIRARIKVGYKSHFPDIDRCIDIAIPSELDIPFKIISHNKESIALQMLKLIDILPQDVNDFIYFPELQKEEEKKNSLYNIAIFPYAGSSIKNWSENYFLELILMLSLNHKVENINLYFSNTEEAQFFLNNDFKNNKINILSGLNFDEMLKSLNSNNLCIANNSFGAHISSYLGINTIGLFGGHELYQEWGPVFNKSIILFKPIECSPCHLENKSLCSKNIECLLDISPFFVYNLILKIIDNNGINNENILDENDIRKNRIKYIDLNINEYGINHVISDILLNSITDVLDKNDINHKRLMLDISKSISFNFPINRNNYNLFIDISELIRQDKGTGIQRVVKNILGEFLSEPPNNYSVVPIYINNNIFYKSESYFSKNSNKIIDHPVEFYPGDILFLPDLSPLIINVNEKLNIYRSKGVRIYFFLYDLLPYLNSKWFSPGTNDWFTNWLSIIAMYDGIICSSNDVANQFIEFYKTKNFKRQRSLKLFVQHLGSDFINAYQSKGIPENSELFLNRLDKRLNFLMVGTLEPRKGHLQVLSSFEKLWLEGIDANLVIVGKEGWMAEKLINRINNHPEAGRRLFWLKEISDEFLEKIYSLSNCLIIASEGEGFGLPLIEGARKQIPIIARSLAVFNEIGGEGVYYFSGNECDDLAKAIKNWILLYQNNLHPKSDLIPLITWKDSIQNIKKFLLDEEWTYKIFPNGSVQKR